MGDALLWFHAAATAIMVVTIWFVQVVHYPLFRFVSPEAFPAFHEGHVQLISRWVVPAMLAELASAIALFLLIPARVSVLEAVSGALLLSLVWAWTFLVSVPLHDRLHHQATAQAVQQLVRTNWLRTLAWSGRGALAASMLLPDG